MDLLKYKVVQDYSEFLEMKDDWDTLVNKSNLKGRIFQEHEWLNVWYRNYRFPCSLYIIVLYGTSEEPVAIAPLCLVPRRKFGMSGNAVCFMGISMSDYCEVICDSDYEDQQRIYRTLFHVLENRRRDWSLVSLDEIPEESSLFRYISEHTIHKFSGITYCSDCSYVDTSVSWDEYSTRIFPKGMRRKERSLLKNGELQLGRISQEPDIAPFMNELFETHIARWADTDSPSRFLEESQKTYFMDMAMALFPSDMVDLSYLALNGEKIAFHFGFRDSERLYLYLHTFNPAFQKYSVGRIFLYYLIRSSYNKFKFVDFLRGSEAYKAHFDLVNETNYRFGFYKSSLHMWVHSKLGHTALVD